MNKRENVLHMLRREGYSQIPCDIQFTPPKEKEFAEKSPYLGMEDYFNLSHRVSRRLLLPAYEGDGKQLFSGISVPEKFDVDVFGVGMSYGSKEAYHMCHFHSPLEGDSVTLEQLQDFALPVTAPEQESQYLAFTTTCRSAGLASFAALEQTIWERAWLIRGMNSLMMDMLQEPDKAACILDAITEHSCTAARLCAKTGHDIIGLGDDIGMQHTVMMSPDLWRTWLKPRLAKVIEAIRRERKETLVLYHSCGFIEPFIPELIEIGVDILNPVQPECMDFEKLHAAYGNKVSFWGGIGTQTTFPFGTPDDIRNRIHELVRICGEQGGIVIGPTHTLEPEVPWENIEAMRAELAHLNAEAPIC